MIEWAILFYIFMGIYMPIFTMHLSMNLTWYQQYDLEVEFGDFDTVEKATKIMEKRK